MNTKSSLVKDLKKKANQVQFAKRNSIKPDPKEMKSLLITRGGSIKEFGSSANKLKEMNKTVTKKEIGVSNNAKSSLDTSPRIIYDPDKILKTQEEINENNSTSNNNKLITQSVKMFPNNQTLTEKLDNEEIEDLISTAKTKEKISSSTPIKRIFGMNQPADLGNTSQIKVVSRFRPLNQVELEMFQKKMGSIASRVDTPQSVIITNNLNNSQTFTLDRIFDSDTTQQELYENVASSTIEDVLNGYNGTIFAYGQSGSGKTFSMYGTDLYDDESKGIIPRAVQQIFDFINDDNNKDIKFELKFSMLEIYREGLHDLLNPSIRSSDLKIKEHPKKGIYVTNLTEEYISNEDEFLIMIENADEFRVVGETGLNKTSSRSHLVFQLEIIQKLPDDTERRGILNLIDLAGSEKVAKTHAVGETLEEAKKINLSLSTLGNVISALTSGKSDYVPYRDSKLTRILQDSLGGNYKTTLIVTCSPHVYNCEETISTLNFASRAKKIKNKVKMNIKRSVEQLEAMIEDLNKKLLSANNEIFKLKTSNGENHNTLFNFSNINNANINVNANISPETFYFNNFNSYANESNSNLSKGGSKKKFNVEEINTNYLNIIKQKDEENQSLNDKMDQLQEENKNLQDKLTRISRETGYIYFYQILENLENFTKKNVDEIKNMNFNKEENKKTQIDFENEKLRENYKNLEKKYFDLVKELENKFKVDENPEILENSYYDNNNLKIPAISCSSSFSFDETLSKYEMNFSQFFDEAKLNSITDSYKNIYKNSKLYVNSILKEFMKKKNIFGSKYNSDSIMPIFSDSDVNPYPYNENKELKRKNSEMNSSLMKMNLVLVYYEKVIFDLLNRVLVDIKRLEIESNQRIDIESKCENFNKSLVMYLEILDDLKEMKSLKEIEDNKSSRKNRRNTLELNHEEIKENDKENEEGAKIDNNKMKFPFILRNDDNDKENKNHQETIEEIEHLEGCLSDRGRSNNDNSNIEVTKQKNLTVNLFRSFKMAKVNEEEEENVEIIEEKIEENVENVENVEKIEENIENKDEKKKKFPFIPKLNITTILEENNENITTNQNNPIQTIPTESESSPRYSNDYNLNYEKRESQDLEQRKLNRLEKNLNYLKMNNFLQPDIKHHLEPITPTNKLNSIIGNESASIINHNKIHNNLNIIKPVQKNFSTKLVNNFNLLVNKLCQIEANKLEDNIDQKEDSNTVGEMIKSFNNNITTVKRKSKNINWLRDSLVGNPKLLGININKENNFSSVETLRELNQAKKELGIYKNTMESLSGELDYLKANNIKFEKIIIEFQENQNKISQVEIENFAHTLKIYKCLYQEEIKQKRNIIDEMAKIVDDVYLNSNSNSKSNLSSLKLGNFEQNIIPTLNTIRSETPTNNNVFVNYINTRQNMQSFRNNTIINDFCEYQKEKLLTEIKSINNDNYGNDSVMKIAEAMVKDGGGATKKLDYVLFQINKNFDELKIEYGCGLNGIYPSKSPLSRNFHLSLVGDTHSDVDSPEALD